MKFKIKTDNLTKTIDTDDFMEKDVDTILDNEIYYLRKEEGKMFGTTSSVIEIEEDEMMNCGICNQEMEHINDIGLRCMNCDLDQEPIKEVFVVIEMSNGLIEDVTVYKQEPENLTPIDDFGDNGHHVYQLPIESAEEEA